MYTSETHNQTILRLVNGGATTRHRIEPIVETRPGNRRAAVTRTMDWMALVVMGVAGAAAGIVSIANALPR